MFACKFMAILYNPMFWTECCIITIIIVIVLASLYSIMPHLIRVIVLCMFFFTFFHR